MCLRANHPTIGCHPGIPAATALDTLAPAGGDCAADSIKRIHWWQFYLDGQLPIVLCSWMGKGGAWFPAGSSVHTCRLFPR